MVEFRRTNGSRLRPNVETRLRPTLCETVDEMRNSQDQGDMCSIGPRRVIYSPGVISSHTTDEWRRCQDVYPNPPGLALASYNRAAMARGVKPRTCQSPFICLAPYLHIMERYTNGGNEGLGSVQKPPDMLYFLNNVAGQRLGLFKILAITNIRPTTLIRSSL
jgi:hypothetical protein